LVRREAADQVPSPPETTCLGCGLGHRGAPGGDGGGDHLAHAAQDLRIDGAALVHAQSMFI
jgi:hypothetical protein